MRGLLCQQIFLLCSASITHHHHNVHRLKTPRPLPVSIEPTPSLPPPKQTNPSSKQIPGPPKVIIEVGPQKKCFILDQSLICKKSTYFSKALNGSFKEAKTRLVKLPDVAPVLFRILQNWICCGKLTLDGCKHVKREFSRLAITEQEVKNAETGGYGLDTVSSSNGDGCHKLSNNHADGIIDWNSIKINEPATWTPSVLTKLWILADRLDIRGLRATSIDALIRRLAKQPHRMDLLLIRYIYANTTSSSPLQKFAIHAIIDERSDHMFEYVTETPPKLPRGFLNAVLKTLDIDLGRRKVPYLDNMCFYHEHIDYAELKACRASKSCYTSLSHAVYVRE